MSDPNKKAVPTQKEEESTGKDTTKQENNPHDVSLDDIKDAPKSREFDSENKDGEEENKDNDLASGGKKEKKPSSPEFGSLKDIDGNIIRHESIPGGNPEDPNQKVHFKIEAQEEFEEEPESPARANLNKKPRKSILKKSLSFKSVGEKDGGEHGGDQGVDSTTQPEHVMEPQIKDSVEFLSVWKEIKNNPKAIEKFFYSRAKPMDFSSIFADGIEIELLSEIIEKTGELAHINSRLALDALECITEIKDFETVSKSLNDQQRIDIHTMFVKLKTSLNLREESISPISEKYLA